MTNLSLTYSNNFSANNVSLYKTIVLSQNLIHIQNKFNDIIFDNKDMLKIIQSLSENKTHGHDGIPTRMLKLSSSSIIP